MAIAPSYRHKRHKGPARTKATKAAKATKATKATKAMIATNGRCRGGCGFHSPLMTEVEGFHGFVKSALFDRGGGNHRKTKPITFQG